MLQIELFSTDSSGLSVQLFGFDFYATRGSLFVLVGIVLAGYLVRRVNLARIARRSRRLYAANQLRADNTDATGADTRISW